MTRLRTLSPTWLMPFGLVLAMLTVPSAAQAATRDCEPWTKTRVASGYGVLENLAFDGRGSMLLSETSLVGSGALVARTADGAKRTVVPDVKGPGGIVIDGRVAYFNTGNTIASGLLGTKDGTIDRVDLDTGERSTVARGLSMPNGLIAIPDGFLVSRDAPVGPSTMTLIRPDGSRSSYAPTATSTNGMAYDAPRHTVYADSTFNVTTTISIVDADNPGEKPEVRHIPGLGPLNSADDLTLGSDGLLYVALNVAGKVVSVDPDTGATCTIATGVPFVSSVRFGSGPGWDAASLYATSFLGTVTKLSPED